MQKKRFSRPRFVGSRRTGLPFLVMHTCYSPGRVKYGSRALSRSAIQSRANNFFIVLHFCAGNSGIHAFKGGTLRQTLNQDVPLNLSPPSQVLFFYTKYLTRDSTAQHVCSPGAGFNPLELSRLVAYLCRVVSLRQ